MRYNVLVVREAGDKDWQQLESHLGKRKGFHILASSAVKDAMTTIKGEHVHILIADYDLPRDSLKFLRRVKTLKPHIEVIFLSRKVTLSRAIEAMKEGAYDFYELPVSNRLLMAVLDKAIEKQTLFLEKSELEKQVREKFDFSTILGRSKAMQHVMGIVSSVALKDVSILITGETGTGKELVASAIHYNSPRSSKPFIKVNCAAFNEGVLESELFGHEKGAFTGAIATRVGRFELADGGTVFLDEVGDISPAIQVRLLRVLHEKEFERVGGNETKKVDVRVIAATNKDLKGLIEKGRFRDDLYYRLNVVNIELPPLRDRTEDIPLLVSHFINSLNTEKGYHIKGISREAMQILLNYRWPGNVRELENAIESAMALTDKNVIEAKYLPSFLLLSPPAPSDFYQIPKDIPLKDMERKIMVLTLERTGGNKTRAARMLGIGLRTLQRNL